MSPDAEPTLDGRSPTAWWSRAVRRLWLPSEQRAVVEHMRGLTWQRWAWPVGFVYDILALRFVFVGASWRWVLGLRLLGVPLQPLVVWFARRPGAADDAVMLAAFTYTLLTVTLMALQSLAFEGLESPYVLGVLGFTFAGSLVAELRPSRVTQAVGAWLVLWVAVMLVGSAWFSGVAAQLRTLRSPLYFLGLWGIVVAVAAASVHFGRRISSLRRELRAARELARYRLQARIGVGGMNEVWLAWDAHARRNVALKILHRDPSPDAVRRFQREAEALQTLRDEHTVRIFEAGASDDGVMFIAMEHLDGADLDRLVTERGALPPARALSLLRQACSALMEAHAQGIVHRDIKPSNLFLTRHPTEGDRLKVIDFGIARRLDDESRLTLDGDAVGTPHFMAPEGLSGGAVGPQADVYGLGATLYFLLTGQRPFEGLSGPALFNAVTSAPVLPPSLRAPHALPSALDAVVLRALARDRTHRHATVIALDAELAALQPTLYDATPAPRPDEPPPSPRVGAQDPTRGAGRRAPP